MATTTEKFYSPLRAESKGSIRGKIPTSMIRFMGAEADDVIEMTVTKTGKTAVITESKVVKGPAAAKLREASSNAKTAPAATKAPAAKAPLKRTTQVAMEKPAATKTLKKATVPAKTAPVVAKKTLKKPVRK